MPDSQHIHSIKCTHVLVQVNLGFYDADGNLVREEPFPQFDGNMHFARVYHPHGEQLTILIAGCIEQARQKHSAGEQVHQGTPSPDSTGPAAQLKEASEARD